jgi:nicotinamide mononucleotide adenylyltransferase
MEQWSKKIHVQSSLPPKEGQFAMFIGRWQPLHDGHKALFRQAIEEGKNVLICIRDGQVDEKNPFSAHQVLVNVSNALMDLIRIGRVKVMIIPDICSVEFGRGVGYDVIEHVPPQEIHDISATKIREQLKAEGKL